MLARTLQIGDIFRAAMTYLLALDQGTSSTRSIVFDQQGNIVALAQKEIAQIYPEPGWVEHDPMEIWHTQLSTAQEAIAKAGLKASDIHRSEEHTSELQSLMRISYAVFCLKKKNTQQQIKQDPKYRSSTKIN